jgi:hypothetical protein
MIGEYTHYANVHLGNIGDSRHHERDGIFYDISCR